MIANPEKVIAEYVGSWNKHDIEGVMSYFTEDLVYEDQPTAHICNGMADMKAYLEKSFTTTRDLSFIVTSVSGGEDHITWEWRMLGTLVSLENQASEPPKMDVRGISLTRFRGEKIEKNTDYWDLPSMLLQLGLVSPDALPRL